MCKKVIPRSPDRPKYNSDGRKNKRRTKPEALFILAMTLIMTCIYIVSMGLFMWLSNRENDTLLKSMYFYIVTMTTIGFGDIAIIDVSSQVVVRVVFVYCLGFCLMSGVIDITIELLALLCLKPPVSAKFKVIFI